MINAMRFGLLYALNPFQMAPQYRGRQNCADGVLEET